MKTLACLLSAVILTGCATNVPVVTAWPDVPKDLLEACPDLKTLDPANDKLSTVVESVTDNYQEYYKCKDKVADWTTWYMGQKELWKTLK